MKIYFAGSIRGGRDDKEIYESIIAELQTYGEVLTEHVGKVTLSEKGEEQVSEEYIYNRDMEWLREADVVVAEVSTPSLGVGYEISWAEQHKPVLCLYQKNSHKKLSAMIRGNKHITVWEYQTVNDVQELLKSYFN